MTFGCWQHAADNKIQHLEVNERSRRAPNVCGRHPCTVPPNPQRVGPKTPCGLRLVAVPLLSSEIGPEAEKTSDCGPRSQLGQHRILVPHQNLGLNRMPGPSQTFAVIRFKARTEIGVKNRFSPPSGSVPDQAVGRDQNMGQKRASALNPSWTPKLDFCHCQLLGHVRSRRETRILPSSEQMLDRNHVSGQKQKMGTS